MLEPETRKINADLLADLLGRAGIRPGPQELERLWRFHRFLREENRSLNMTRIHNFENIVRKHYVDSLIILDILKTNGLEPPSPLMDMGSGAGFPGMPLAILRPDLEFVLNDGRKHRTDYLKRGAEMLGLKNVRVFTRKISPESPLPPLGGVITRAVESQERTLEKLLPNLQGGARILFMKGPNCDDEIASARERFDGQAKLILDAAYALPDSRDKRRLIVWESLSTRVIEAKPRGPVTIQEISSESNAKFKELKSLHLGRNIKKLGRTLICGSKITGEIARNKPELIHASVYPDHERWFHREEEGLEFLGEDLFNETDSPPPVWVFKPELFRALDILNTGPPLLLADAPEIPAWDPAQWKAGCVMLLPLGDPENLGAALRTGAAFGVESVVLLPGAAHPFHPRAVRASAGACFEVKLFRGSSPGAIFQELQEADVPVLALDAEGEDIRELTVPEKFALLIGEEGRGLPEEARAPRPDTAPPRRAP